eukprot:TRINITY_DN26647_c0_g1_i1.p1 TRINITY_DN26647_c0_g1~~TRINITY_DN26647_c0_g1_i1.p1  ORF type:complete len:1221 (+),score=280.46 TRINITY_DN26647_c0_g1_i1:65-3727(+)
MRAAGHLLRRAAQQRQLRWWQEVVRGEWTRTIRHGLREFRNGPETVRELPSASGQQEYHFSDEQSGAERVLRSPPKCIAGFDTDLSWESDGWRSAKHQCLISRVRNGDGFRYSCAGISVEWAGDWEPVQGWSRNVNAGLREFHNSITGETITEYRQGGQPLYVSSRTQNAVEAPEWLGEFDTELRWHPEGWVNVAHDTLIQARPKQEGGHTFSYQVGDSSFDWAGEWQPAEDPSPPPPSTEAADDDGWVRRVHRGLREFHNTKTGEVITERRGLESPEYYSEDSLVPAPSFVSTFDKELRWDPEGWFNVEHGTLIRSAPGEDEQGKYVYYYVGQNSFTWAGDWSGSAAGVEPPTEEPSEPAIAAEVTEPPEAEPTEDDDSHWIRTVNNGLREFHNQKTGDHVVEYRSDGAPSYYNDSKKEYLKEVPGWVAAFDSELRWHEEGWVNVAHDKLIRIYTHDGQTYYHADGVSVNWAGDWEPTVAPAAEPPVEQPDDDLVPPVEITPEAPAAAAAAVREQAAPSEPSAPPEPVEVAPPSDLSGQPDPEPAAAAPPAAATPDPEPSAVEAPPVVPEGTEPADGPALMQIAKDTRELPARTTAYTVPAESATLFGDSAAHGVAAGRDDGRGGAQDVRLRIESGPSAELAAHLRNFSAGLSAKDGEYLTAQELGVLEQLVAMASKCLPDAAGYLKVAATTKRAGVKKALAEALAASDVACRQSAAGDALVEQHMLLESPYNPFDGIPPLFPPRLSRWYLRRHALRWLRLQELITEARPEGLRATDLEVVGHLLEDSSRMERLAVAKTLSEAPPISFDTQIALMQVQQMIRLAAAIRNEHLFWCSLRPAAVPVDSEDGVDWGYDGTKLAQKLITKVWGSHKEFEEQLQLAAEALDGAGWVAVVYDHGQHLREQRSKTTTLRRKESQTAAPVQEESEASGYLPAASQGSETGAEAEEEEGSEIQRVSTEEEGEHELMDEPTADQKAGGEEDVVPADPEDEFVQMLCDRKLVRIVTLPGHVCPLTKELSPLLMCDLTQSAFTVNEAELTLLEKTELAEWSFRNGVARNYVSRFLRCVDWRRVEYQLRLLPVAKCLGNEEERAKALTDCMRLWPEVDGEEAETHHVVWMDTVPAEQRDVLGHYARGFRLVHDIAPDTQEADGAIRELMRAEEPKAKPTPPPPPRPTPTADLPRTRHARPKMELFTPFSLSKESDSDDDSAAPKEGSQSEAL